MPDANQLTIPGQYSQIRQACAFVARKAAAAGFDKQSIFYLELACDEACTNIVEHAYGREGDRPIVVECRVVDDAFTLIIHDNGRAFDPTTVPKPPPPPPPENIDTLKIGGLGLHIIRQIMDEVDYSFDPETGNTLTMTLRRHQKGAG